MREIFTSGSVGGAPGNRCFYPDRAEINPQPRESRSGKKLVIANQWVRICNRCKSRLIKAEPAGQ
jgi:hypothetical protein